MTLREHPQVKGATRLSSIERLQVNLPKGFDPDKHARALLTLITKEHGAGWEIDSINMRTGSASISRHAAITEVTQSTQGNSFEVRLTSGTKPSDGDRAAAKFEDQYPGTYMTKFEPFLAKATLSKLTDDEARCRGAVAVALGVKPWDVQVKSTLDGGFELGLPRTYVGSKHDSKLEEVATTVVGRDGWYVSINAQKLSARIIPSEPPTFPEGIAFPLARLGKGNIDKTPFGMVLPAPGEKKGPEIQLDWTASAWCLVAGTPGSGKSVTLNALIADALSNGSELAVVDDVSKAVDFEWCKPFCRPGGWGCDSIESGVATLGLVRQEGKRRAGELKRLGINNWLDMPPGKRFTPILVIVDEVSALVVADPIPKGVPKDHPLYMEIAERNLARAMLQSFMRKIVAELRFVGVRMVLSTQATNANTGVDPAMRTLIGHKILQGVNPSRAARSQIFADETSVPQVPENVKAGGKRAKGVGVSTLEGEGPLVYKSYFASTGDYRSALLGLGVTERTERAVTPTSAQIDEFLPSLDDGKNDKQAGAPSGGPERAPSGRLASEVAKDMGDEYGVAVHNGSLGSNSFEVANAARRAAANTGKPTKKEKAMSAEEAEWAGRSGEVTVIPAPETGDDW